MIGIDKIVEKIVALGVPGLVLLIAIEATGFAGAAALTTALAALGPGGMVGGILTLGVLGLISEGIAEYGFEAIFKAVINELYKRGETKKNIIKKIKSYPISEGLKSKLLKEFLKLSGELQ